VYLSLLCSKKRKSTKRIIRRDQLELKNLNNKTHDQNTAFNATIAIKRQLSEHRERTALLVGSIELRHQVQLNDVAAAGKRRIIDLKLLLEIQCTGLSEEQRSLANKECDSKIGHFLVRSSKSLIHH
jgi:hypothetical protein